MEECVCVCVGGRGGGTDNISGFAALMFIDPETAAISPHATAALILPRPLLLSLQPSANVQRLRNIHSKPFELLPSVVCISGPSMWVAPDDLSLDQDG